MPEVVTSHEGPRGCGYRKPGGLYLVGPELSEPCSALPVPLESCPTCHAGIHPARGWTWVRPDPLLFSSQDGRYLPEPHGSPEHAAGCPFAEPGRLGELAGLLWIGEKFYPTPADFYREAAAHGVSRRVASIPRGFKPGETWVLMAHRKAIPRYDAMPGEPAYTPGIVTAFRPAGVDYIVRGDEGPETLARLEKRGARLVAVVKVAQWPEKGGA